MIKRGKPHTFSRFLGQRIFRRPLRRRSFEPVLLCITAVLFFFICSCFNAESSRLFPDRKKSALFSGGDEAAGVHAGIEAETEADFLPITSLLSGLPEASNYKNSEHHIVLFLGYGFSENEKKALLFDFLKNTYGLREDGGPISVLTYPEDVSVSGRIRMSALTAKLKDLHEKKALTGLISAGAPQGTHTVLAALQDADMAMPVFSLFPQDDVLGTEAGSSLVFDYRPALLQDKSGAEAEAHAESDYEYPGDTEQVLFPLIQAALHWDRIKDDEMLIPALRTEFFRRTGCSLVLYTDPATGLRAKNHYVLAETAKDKR